MTTRTSGERLSRHRSFAVAFAAVLLCSPAIAQPPVAWTNAAGANPVFSWFSGQNSHTDFFGSPAVDDAGFHFTPGSFFSPQPAANEAADLLNVGINMAAPTSTVIVREQGTWSHPLGAASLQMTADVTFFNSDDPFAGVASFPLNVTFTNAGGFGGGWEAEFILNTGPATHPATANPLSNFVMTLRNSLQTANGGTLTKDRIDIFVPEPASAITFAAAGLFLIKRRKRPRRG